MECKVKILVLFNGYWSTIENAKEIAEDTKRKVLKLG